MQQKIQQKNRKIQQKEANTEKTPQKYWTNQQNKAKTLQNTAQYNKMAQDGKPPATIRDKIRKNATKTAARQQPSGAGWTFRANFGLHLPTPGAHLRLPPRGRDPALPRGASASEGSAEAVPTARWSAEEESLAAMKHRKRAPKAARSAAVCPDSSAAATVHPSSASVRSASSCLPLLTEAPLGGQV